MRPPATRALVTLADEIFGTIRTLITGMLERWAAAGGALPVPAHELTPVFLSLVQGFVFQQALAGTPLADDYSRAVNTLVHRRRARRADRCSCRRRKSGASG